MQYSTSTAQALIAQRLGALRVDRATDTLPQTNSEDLFTIAGGRVLVTCILGEVTTVLGAVGNITLEHNPTVGTTTAISAVAAGGALEEGALISIAGAVGTATQLTNGGSVAIQSRPLAVTVGTITVKTSASDTGSVKWSLWYLPLDAGAVVTATAI